MPPLLPNFLLKLEELHAPPAVLLALPVRPLVSLTIAVSTTLYAPPPHTLRPAALLRAARGVRRLRLEFAREVDGRSVVRCVGACAVLGTDDDEEERGARLESLEIEVASALGRDEEVRPPPSPHTLTNNPRPSSAQ